MSGVSFGSGYKIYSTNDKDYQNVTMLQKDLKPKITYSTEDTMLKKENKSGYLISSIYVDDTADFDLERYCAYNGIRFEKLDKDAQLLEDKEILTTSIYPNRSGDYKFVNINGERLYELIKSADDDVAGNAKGLLEKSNSFRITHPNTHVMASSVLKIKADGDKITGISFADTPETYFGMMNRGINEIPISVDEETYEICKKYNLLT